MGRREACNIKSTLYYGHCSTNKTETIQRVPTEFKTHINDGTLRLRHIVDDAVCDDEQNEEVAAILVGLGKTVK